MTRKKSTAQEQVQPPVTVQGEKKSFMNVIETSQGHYFRFRESDKKEGADIITPESVIDINDIAHALSNICRFTGHTREFYSVAQHSVLCSYILPGEFGLEKLLHDAAEAYIGDMSTPLKSLFPDYIELEKSVSNRIADHFGLAHGYSSLPEVKFADTIILITEKRDLMPDLPHDPDMWQWVLDQGIYPVKPRIDVWSPEESRMMFLQRYDEFIHPEKYPELEAISKKTYPVKMDK